MPIMRCLSFLKTDILIIFIIVHLFFLSGSSCSKKRNITVVNGPAKLKKTINEILNSYSKINSVRFEIKDENGTFFDQRDRALKGRLIKIILSSIDQVRLNSNTFSITKIPGQPILDTNLKALLLRAKRVKDAIVDGESSICRLLQSDSILEDQIYLIDNLKNFNRISCSTTLSDLVASPVIDLSTKAMRLCIKYNIKECIDKAWQVIELRPRPYRLSAIEMMRKLGGKDSRSILFYLKSAFRDRATMIAAQKALEDISKRNK